LGDRDAEIREAEGIDRIRNGTKRCPLSSRLGVWQHRKLTYL